MHVYVCTHIHMCIYIYTYVYIYICMCTHNHVTHVYTHTHAKSYMCIHKNTKKTVYIHVFIILNINTQKMYDRITINGFLLR